MRRKKQLNSETQSTSVPFEIEYRSGSFIQKDELYSAMEIAMICTFAQCETERKKRQKAGVAKRPIQLV
jgi:hypothetical protein